MKLHVRCITNLPICIYKNLCIIWILNSMHSWLALKAIACSRLILNCVVTGRTVTKMIYYAILNTCMHIYCKYNNLLVRILGRGIYVYIGLLKNFLCLQKLSKNFFV